jgi:phospholipase C
MIRKNLRWMAAIALASNLALVTPSNLLAGPQKNAAEALETATPIKHVIVIFGENISFDHYFATYPAATNPEGEPTFAAAPDTPTVNNLLSGGLLTENPNSTQPFRMDTGLMSVTCDQNHSYTPEQEAMDHGLMDKYPQYTGTGNTAGSPCNDYGKGTGSVMGYFDGNTVTALWNYAQHYAMSDNSYSTMFGPSTVGALNLIAGTTEGAVLYSKEVNGSTVTNGSGVIANSLFLGPILGDVRPLNDQCVLTDPGLQTAKMASIAPGNKNVGDLLNAQNITWGWFQGGFAPTGVDAMGRAICGQHHAGLAGDDAVTQSSDGDYIPHHQPFQFFASTQNLNHAQPKDPALIGTSTDGANHQYDLSLFLTALDEDRLPAVTYLKAAAYQDGHPGYSDPIDEQYFVVSTIDAVMNTPYWKDTAIIVAYDDSDGWYDHVLGPIANQSAVADDELAAPGSCGSATTTTQGQCGYGPRQPLIVISPYAKKNYVDHVATDQSSILRFIEDNWNLGRIGGNSDDVKAGTLNGMFDFTKKAPKVILDPATGLVLTQNDN